MIDNTAALSRAYSALIEQPGVSQSEIDYKAMQIMRGLEADSIFYALQDHAEDIKRMVIQGNECLLGFAVNKALKDYCERVAIRELEA